MEMEKIGNKKAKVLLAAGMLAEIASDLQGRFGNFEFSVFSEQQQIPGIAPCKIFEGAQYNAESFIKPLSKLRRNKNAMFAIGSTKLDLYTPHLNFVFGCAIPKSKCAVIALARLSDEKEKFLERTQKEAIHEFFHLLEMEHCANPECIMHFSNSLADTDYKEKELCARCKGKLKRSFGRQ